MAQEKLGKGEKTSAGEKAGKLYRDFNAIGAVAVVAPAVLAAPLWVWAGVNAAQAGGGEWFRRYSRKKRLKQNPS